MPACLLAVAMCHIPGRFRRYLCEQQREPSDTLRFVVTTAEPGGSSKPKIVGYMIVDFAIPHYEVERCAVLVVGEEIQRRLA
jgi:hypothetical protein